MTKKLSDKNKTTYYGMPAFKVPVKSLMFIIPGCTVDFYKITDNDIENIKNFQKSKMIRSYTVFNTQCVN